MNINFGLTGTGIMFSAVTSQDLAHSVILGEFSCREYFGDAIIQQKIREINRFDGIGILEREGLCWTGVYRFAGTVKAKGYRYEIL